MISPALHDTAGLFDPFDFDYWPSQMDDLSSAVDVFEYTTAAAVPPEPQRSIARRRQQPFKVDISQTKEDFVVRAELPGLAKDDISLKFTQPNLLSIEAHVPKAQGEHMILSERASGKVSRRIRIPKSADIDSAQVALVDGLLTMRFHKHQSEPEKVLAIQ